MTRINCARGPWRISAPLQKGLMISSILMLSACQSIQFVDSPIPVVVQPRPSEAFLVKSTAKRAPSDKAAR